jgi:hypothetical protein
VLAGGKRISSVQLENSVRWFKQAWNDLSAARNDFECDNPAPEWACYKSLQVITFELLTPVYVDIVSVILYIP